MRWDMYKTALLERMQNSSTIDGLISFILKPHDNGCPIGLWVAERIAERRLLNEDGIELSEDTWLEFVLAFVTNEEKQTLQVPARDQRSNYDNGAGYTVVALQRSLTRFDPATFKRFQQSHCQDPVPVRVITLHRLVAAEKAASPPKGRAKPELESHAATKEPSSRSTPKPKDKFDKQSALPIKEGKPDQALYATFPEKSLRRRLWDAVVAGKCTRCSGPHLRVACIKPRQGWEDDFEKEEFFSRPPPAANKKQLRVQLTGNSLNLPVPQILSVMSPLGRCLVDTCSDVSVARRDVLAGVHYTGLYGDVLIGHLGGETLLRNAGSLELGRSDGMRPVILTDVYVVEPKMLPAGVVALFGVADIRALGLSLDAVLAHPGHPWEQSVRLSWLGRVRAFFGMNRSPAPLRGNRVRVDMTDMTLPAPVAPRHLPDASTSRVETPEALGFDEERALLDDTKARHAEEQGRRTANRVAALFQEELERKHALKAKKAAAKSSAPAHASSSSSSTTFRYAPGTWPRKRTKYYAVRKGRKPGIYETWEECEQQTKGITSEFKSFGTFDEAVAYLNGRRLNFMAFRRPKKPPIILCWWERSSCAGRCLARRPPRFSSSRLRLGHHV
jgi:hypothetical protein